MADRRTNIIINVQGLADLQAANTAMNRHKNLVDRLAAAYTGLNAITGTAGSGMTSLNQTFNNTNNTLNTTNSTTNNLRVSLRSVGQSAQQADGNFISMLGTLLKYRAIAAIFGEIQKAIGETIRMNLEFEKQTARIARVGGSENTPFVRAGMAEEIARTGASIEDVGEAYYQLRTQIKEGDVAFSALRNTMNLVVGTQSDARDTSRALLQIYNQFGDSLDHNVGKSENLRRITELLAITFKDADAEMNDITASLKYLGPIAEAARVPLEQVTATISALTTEGHRGRMGGTEAAQFIASLIKNYNEALGGIEKNGLVFHFDLARTKEGGVDLINTLRSIVETANSLPTEKAQQFLRAISASQNVYRFLGSAGTEFMQHLAAETDRATAAMKGQTREAERLKDTMLTTAQEASRVWSGFITVTSNLIDGSGLRGLFHGWAEDITRAAEAYASFNRLQGDREAFNRNTLAGSGTEAQRLTRDTINQALQRNQQYNNRLPIQNLTAGSPIDWMTDGMTTAQRDMIRARYFQTNRPLEVVVADMNRDRATLDQQLATAPVRSAPQALPTASVSNLHGLTPAQAENAAIITAAAKKYGLDPLALIAVAHYESTLDAGNKNRTSTATGLFQILQSTAPNIDRKDPRQNAEFAAREVARIGGGGLTGEAAIRKIVEGFERPDVPGHGHANADREIADSIRFYRNQGGAGPHGPAVTKSPDTLQKEADEAEKKVQEARDNYAKRLQTEYERLAKDIDNVNDPRVIAAARKADAAHAAAADADERLRIKYGLSGNLPNLLKDQAKEREQAQKDREQAQKDAEATRKEALKQHAGATEYYAELAPQKYGLFSDMATRRAQEAQQAALEAARSDGDIVLSWKLLAGVEGPLKTLMDSRKEAMDTLQAQTEQANQNFAQYQQAFAGAITESSDRQIRALQRTARPNAPGGGADARQEAVLTGTVASLQKTLDVLRRIQDPTEETTSKISEMKERLLDANAALVEFKDTIAEKDYQRKLKAEDDRFDLSAQQITRLHGLRFNKDEEKAFADEMQKLRELLANDQAHLEAVLARPLLHRTPEEIEQAKKRVQADRDRLSDYPTEYGNRKYAETYYQVQGELKSSLLEFFHGKGSIGDVVQRAGSSIVDAALESQIKRFSDPLVNSITQEILELQHNTDALQSMANALQGGGSATSFGVSGISGAPGGIGGAVAVGVAAGLTSVLGSDGIGGAASGASAGVAGSARQKSLLPGKGDKYLNEGLAAYSVFSQSQQQGSTLGSVLGGALAGAAIGGPIGAIVGGGLSLLGGLFHQKSKPTETPQNLNPSAYNAPANFDVAAYNYSAYGKLPTLADVGFDVKAAKSPVVNVYVDGAKVAARQEVASQTSLSRVSLTNMGAGYGHTPI